MRVRAWLFGAEDARRLAALRIGLLGVLALRLSRTAYVKLADQPEAAFQPLSFMHLLSHQPPRGVVIALQVIGVSAAVLGCLGVRARVSIPVAWAVGVFLGGMTTSIGKVVHNDVLLLLCITPLMLAPCAEAWALGARTRPVPAPSARFGWAIRADMVVVAGAYFFAGFWKLASAGLSWVTSDNMRWVLYNASDNQASPNPIALFVADRPLLAHAIAAFTLLLEITFPVVLVWVWSRRFYVAATVGMHAGIWVTMHLDYWPQAAAVVIVLTDWGAVRARFAHARPGVAVRITGA